MTVFSYVVARDFGFAPNPFNGTCTLATCKPPIRKHASVGDWVVGTGSKSLGCGKKLIYCMEVNEKLSYNRYWNDPRFSGKKPVMNGSLKTMYGDNIYFNDGSAWHQEDSHHSHEDGSINHLNLNRDTSADDVLISNNFYFFGKSCIDIPEEIVSEICKNGVGYKHVNPDVFMKFMSHVKSKYAPGYIDDPVQFGGSFKRYDGN